MATVVTKTIKPAGGGDYTTLAAANTARARALTDTIERWECYGGDSGPLTPSATWSVDSTSSLEIIAAEGARHMGVWDTVSARVVGVINGASNIPLRVYYMLLQATNYPLSCTSEAGLSAFWCISKITGNNSGYGVRGCNLYGCTLYRDTYGLGCGAQQPSTFTHAVEWVNCTAYNFSSVGFKIENGTVTAKNCLAQGCADGFNGTFSASSDYNCSDIAGDAPGAHSVTGTVQFKDAANKDFHLAAADTVARGAGVNLTSSGITTDIDGETRPATGAWDIGADQYAAAVTERNPWGKKPWGRNPWNRARWKAAA